MKISLTRGLLSMAATGAFHDQHYQITRMPDIPMPLMWHDAMPTKSRNTVSQKKRRKLARRSK